MKHGINKMKETIRIPFPSLFNPLNLWVIGSLYLCITRSSWLNCALRDDEAVYWVSIGHYESVAVDNWFYWASRGHLCLLYIERSGDLVCCHGFLTHWLTHWQTLKDRATQLLIKYKSGALVTQWKISFEDRIRGASIQDDMAAEYMYIYMEGNSSILLLRNLQKLFHLIYIGYMAHIMGGFIWE